MGRILKSVLAGLGAVAVGILGMVLYVGIVLYVQGVIWGTSVGIDFRAILFTSVLMFAAGFWWQYRKAH